MIHSNRLASSTKQDVRRVLEECSDDEIALDGLAQWASDTTASANGYEVEENYPVIRENLSSRFNISEAIATEYAMRLREYGTKFMLTSDDLGAVRSKTLELLQTDLGRKWRQGIFRRLAKASLETRRAVYLISLMKSMGFTARTLEEMQDQFQAYFSAAFGSPSPARVQKELIDIGILNPMMSPNSSDASSVQRVHSIIPLVSIESFGLKAEDLKIQPEAKQFIARLFDKQMFDQ
ncbi:MAG: hypothetical protein ACRDF4_08755, partial [Rhabdochlamydiaceae bacterium]